MLHKTRTTFAQIPILQAFVFAVLLGGLLVVTAAAGQVDIYGGTDNQQPARDTGEVGAFAPNHIPHQQGE